MTIASTSPVTSTRRAPGTPAARRSFAIGPATTSPSASTGRARSGRSSSSSSADGRWAMVTKTHHCMVDGVGSVDIGQTILDPEPDSERPAARERTALGRRGRRAVPAPRSTQRPARRPAAAAGSAAARTASFGIGLGRGVAGIALAGAGVATHPQRGREALRRSRAMAEVLVRDEFTAAAPTSLNQPIGAARSLAVIEAPLEELKAIKRSLGGTVNDVVLAVTAGGLRRLFEHRDEPPPRAGVRAMVPVNIRSAAERLALGNRITSLFVHLPVAEPDPLRRYELQVDEAEALKAGTQALGSREIVDLAAHAPPSDPHLPRPLVVRDPALQRNNHQRPGTADAPVRVWVADAGCLAPGPTGRRACGRHRRDELRRPRLFLRQRGPGLGSRPRCARRRNRRLDRRAGRALGTTASVIAEEAGAARGCAVSAAGRRWPRGEMTPYP